MGYRSWVYRLTLTIILPLIVTATANATNAHTGAALKPSMNRSVGGDTAGAHELSKQDGRIYLASSAEDSCNSYHVGKEAQAVCLATVKKDPSYCSNYHVGKEARAVCLATVNKDPSYCSSYHVEKEAQAVCLARVR